MPDFDFDEVLTDPDFLDVFNVTRRADNPNGFGEAAFTPSSFQNLRGVVTPASPSALKRLPEEQRQSKTLEIITRFALRGASNDAGQDYQPDLIFYAGNNYVVTDVQDWSRYGAGWVSALCTLNDVVPAPPKTNVSPTFGPVVIPGGGGSSMVKHFPLEVIDGVRTKFTFVGLPADATKYVPFYNGAAQDGLTQTGQVLDFGVAPKPASSGFPADIIFVLF